LPMLLGFLVVHIPLNFKKIDSKVYALQKWCKKNMATKNVMHTYHCKTIQV
jgi:hypothetical protein